MSLRTGIEWTDATWNPIRGCTRVSEGCRNCYAETVAARFSSPGQPYAGLARMTTAGPRWTGMIRVVEEHLDDPLRWQRPRRVFVNSMSDLFHDGVSDSTIGRIFARMAAAPRHTFQVLTKRPDRMMTWIRDAGRDATASFVARLPARARVDIGPAGMPWPLPNVWLGVSVEDQRAADTRVPQLLNTPAAVRFLSCEPLLGPVDLRRWLPRDHAGDCPAGDPDCLSRDGECHDACVAPDDQLHWVIVGGESGRGARPMHPAWASALRDQCASAGVAFFFKQWGEWLPFASQSPCLRTDGVKHFARVDGRVYCDDALQFLTADGAYDRDADWAVRVGKKASGRMLDGRTWDQMPGGAA